MSSTRADFALLLASPDPVEAALAGDLLTSAGIPSLLHGQDRDIAELGAASHASIARPDLLVPRSALLRARQVLSEAWTDTPLADEDPASTRAMESAPWRSAFLWFWFLFLLLGPMVLVLLLARAR